MAIHVTLLHNTGAGFGQTSKKELLSALAKKGFETTYVDIKKEAFAHKLQNPGDLVAIAGGDGTLIKLAPHLVGKNVPIGLLPLGTANNIATSLGIAGKSADIIAAWELDRKKDFSLGIVSGPDVNTFFLESVGFGLFPRLIRQRVGDKDVNSTREEELEDALQHQQEILSAYKPHYCSISLGGKQFPGKYIMVEIMNIKLTGPNLDLAPLASPDDTFLDVVLVREDERDRFAEYLTNRIKGKSSLYQLHVQRAKKVQLEWQGMHYHLDDEAYEQQAPIKMNIELRQKGLEFLAV
jgi:diacylglycerol kinase (ATP)